MEQKKKKSVKVEEEPFPICGEKPETQAATRQGRGRRHTKESAALYIQRKGQAKGREREKERHCLLSNQWAAFPHPTFLVVCRLLGLSFFGTTCLVFSSTPPPNHQPHQHQFYNTPTRHVRQEKEEDEKKKQEEGKQSGQTKQKGQLKHCITLFLLPSSSAAPPPLYRSSLLLRRRLSSSSLSESLEVSSPRRVLPLRLSLSFSHLSVHGMKWVGGWVDGLLSKVEESGSYQSFSSSASAPPLVRDAPSPSLLLGAREPSALTGSAMPEPSNPRPLPVCQPIRASIDMPVWRRGKHMDE